MIFHANSVPVLAECHHNYSDRNQDNPGSGKHRQALSQKHDGGNRGNNHAEFVHRRHLRNPSVLQRRKIKQPRHCAGRTAQNDESQRSAVRQNFADMSEIALNSHHRYQKQSHDNGTDNRCRIGVKPLQTDFAENADQRRHNGRQNRINKPQMLCHRPLLKKFSFSFMQ